MTQEVKSLIAQEKKLSYVLRCLYAGISVFFVSATVILFLMDSSKHSIFLFVVLSTLIIFLIVLYNIIVSLLKTHRKIAKNYQQIFDLESVPSLDTCKQYFKGAGFLVYEDENIIVANKLLLQEHKGFIKRDYLLQIVVISDAISLESYMEAHQENMRKYFAKFQKVVAATTNKMVTVGALVHYVKGVPEDIGREFRVQAGQRYLLKLDIIMDENDKKLYYPSHIESYKDRRWCGQLVPEPYNEIGKFVRSVYL